MPWMIRPTGELLLDIVGPVEDSPAIVGPMEDYELPCPMFFDMPVYIALWKIYSLQTAASDVFNKAPLGSLSIYKEALVTSRYMALRLVLWLIRERDWRLYWTDRGTAIYPDREVTIEWLKEVKKLHHDDYTLRDDIEQTIAEVISKRLE